MWEVGQRGGVCVVCVGCQVWDVAAGRRVQCSCNVRTFTLPHTCVHTFLPHPQVVCEPMKFKDGYGVWLDRTTQCKNTQPVIITITGVERAGGEGA